MAVSTTLLNKVRDSVSDHRIRLNEFETHQDGGYNPIKAQMTITLDTGSFFGDLRINNISVKQENKDEPNEIEILFPAKWNKKSEKAFESLYFRDPRVMEAVREVCRDLYFDALDASEK